MIASIQSYAISQGKGAGGPDSDASAVALQAQLTRCQLQLGDWAACVSGKTPEGRKIIENLRARIETLQSRITSEGKSASARSDAEAPKTRAQDGGWAKAQQTVAHPATAAAMGSLLNVFA